MSRRKRSKGKQSIPRQRHGRPMREPGCDEDDVNAGFIDDLDHAAFHIAEQMREKTQVWKETGYTPITLPVLPELAQPLVRQAMDWERLGRYILKWMRWYLLRDSVVLYGSVMAELDKDAATNMHYLLIGFETQSEANRN